ncbi:MAG: anthranilate synthase component I [Deltaproteobacteria bacterium]|nr:anthranilate synthase component I [Deltaproteobacteria bacterium]
MYTPDFDKFTELAQQGNLIPVYREILSDLETPVALLRKLSGTSCHFLLESMEGGDKWGRYSFLAGDPEMVIKIREEEILVRTKGGTTREPHGGDPLGWLKNLLGRYRPVAVPGLPRFYGGAVGFFGYETVNFFERLPHRKQPGPLPDEAVFLITDTLLIFDHLRQKLLVVACAFMEGKTDLEEVYREQIRKIEALIQKLRAPVQETDRMEERPCPALEAQMSSEEFQDLVRRAKEYIMAGDIIQVVLSQRFQSRAPADPWTLYRALRSINPSPYLFYLKMEELVLIGSSPEVLVRQVGQAAELRPIAGTRKRGGNERSDRELAQELAADPKERAEHIMLVDLGRNDLGRIARTGTVEVSELMTVERYSHVMHLVSHIRAEVAAGLDCFDVFRAAFPAGTLTGAPKIRAMEIIHELEPGPRGPYGGAVGYFSFDGNMDFCITIRTIVIDGRTLSIQAGAGIVADSDPAAEYQETLNKARGLLEAVVLASRGLDS